MKLLIPIKEVERAMITLSFEEGDPIVQNWRKEYGNFRTFISVTRWAWFG